MQLMRTEKARQELRPGVRTLSQKQRSVLLLADGSRSLPDLRGLFDGEAEAIALDLLRAGYLEIGGQQGAAPAARTAGAANRAPAAAAPGPASIPQPAADNFTGKRSLATTRMFLFDLCERMFARRDPALAERVRTELRLAKDRASMLAVSRAMLDEVERLAGHERADSISERLAMLLPPEEEELA